MSNQYKAVAAVLQAAITSINSILTHPDDEMHRIRITNILNMQTDQLMLITGTGDITTGQPAVLGPATTIGGKPIGKQRKFTEADLVPSDDKVFNLKQQVEDAVHYFAPNGSAAGILANIPDLIIRGVAKKAGLKVTKDEPKELTVEFIEEIKKALVDNGITGVVNDDDDEDEEEVAAETINETLVGDVTVDDPKPSDILSKERFEGIFSKLKEQQAEGESSQNDTAKQAEAPKEQPKAEEPKQDQKPKSETDLKKKTGK